MATTTVQVRIDRRVKARAEKALTAMGLSVPVAVRELLSRVAQEGVMPFEVGGPGRGATESALRKDLRAVDAVGGLLADLHGED